MNRSTAAALALATLGLTACGHSTPVAGKSLAQQACDGSGAQAANDAAQAARLNPTFSTLAVDEASLAASEAQQNSELSDGSSNNSGLTSTETLTTPGGLKVVTDCVSLGLQVPH